MFGSAILKDRSPSLDVLNDLQAKGLSLADFTSCLDKIGCQRAINELELTGGKCFQTDYLSAESIIIATE